MARGGGGRFLSSKLRSLSLGNKDKDSNSVDYTADNRAAYLMIKGAMLRTMNDVITALFSAFLSASLSASFLLTHK